MTTGNNNTLHYPRPPFAEQPQQPPGPYWTPLQSSGGQPQEKVQQFGEDTPLGRPGQPVEIAPLYVLLASDTCSYASGQVWCSDGGTGVA